MSCFSRIAGGGELMIHSPIGTYINGFLQYDQEIVVSDQGCSASETHVYFHFAVITNCKV